MVLSKCGLRVYGGTSRLGSRDLVDSGIKCGPHGARRAKRSRGRFVGSATKPTLSRGDRGDQVKESLAWRLCLICEIFGGLPTKLSGFSVEQQTRVWGPDAIEIWSGCEKKLRGGGHAAWSRGFRQRDEARLRWTRVNSMEISTSVQDCPWGVCIFLLCCSGSVVFCSTRLNIYRARGGWHPITCTASHFLLHRLAMSIMSIF
jgi:hypothetical protein